MAGSRVAGGAALSCGSGGPAAAEDGDPPRPGAEVFDAALARWAPSAPDAPWAELRAQALHALPPGSRAELYSEAVCAYFAAARPRYPVSPREVATHPFLAGGPSRPGAAALVDPGGVLYADPDALLQAAAAPSAVARLLPAAPATRPPHRAWAHPPGGFPYAGALLVEGGALLAAGAHPSTGAPLWVRCSLPGDAAGGAAPLAPGDAAWGAAPAPGDAAWGGAASLAPGGAAWGGAASPALKGAQGEARVAAALEAAGYSVLPVAHRPRSADLAVAAGGGEVYVEAKDYSAAVPEKEVKKFLRDLGARGAAGGVLVSLSSGIAGARGALSARTEALPGEGRLAPVVYVAGGGAAAAVAAVDLAAELARRQPPPLPEDTGAGGYDRLEAYAAELDQIGGVYEAARADLGKLSQALAGGCGAALEQLGLALRDHRRLVRTLRGVSEGHAEACEAPPAEVWEALLRRFPVAEGGAREAARALVGRLGGRAGGGELRPLAQWRLLKTRAVHLDSGVALSFARGRAEASFPLALLGGGAASPVPRLLASHPSKVRVGGGALSLELDAETAQDALALW